MAGLVQYNVSSVMASGTSDTTTAPERANDGLGYYDGIQNARWASEPMPEWIQFDMGTSRELSLTRLSFYNFQAGRVYVFTVETSLNGSTWSPVLNNINSAEEEWTIVQFAQRSARYVRVTFNGNNQNNFANLWEGEFWGPDGAFPVELTSFTAILSNNNVTLDWTTATETNNFGFDVERKISNSPSDEWIKIGFVNGAGNSNSVKTYSYVDKSINSGNFIYRLKQLDTDGKFTYSQEVEIQNDKPGTFELSQNYPNPFNPTTVIKFSLPKDVQVKLSVFNILGELVETLVNENLKAGFYEVNFNGNGLASGHYIYRLESENFVEIKKMILIK
jgi:hypothetical protein